MKAHHCGASTVNRGTLKKKNMKVLTLSCIYLDRGSLSTVCRDVLKRGKKKKKKKSAFEFIKHRIVCGVIIVFFNFFSSPSVS